MQVRLLESTSDYGFSLLYHGSDSNDFRIISRNAVVGNNTRLCIERDNGRVGIGTTNPSYFTHIHSNMNDVFKLQTTGGGALNFQASDYSIASPVWNIQSGGSEDIAFSISSNPGEIMRLHNSGNVGIGTTNPDEILEINGWISRTAHNNGGLCGSHNNIGNNGSKTNPIYVIGNNYKPDESELINMYGIGYSSTSAIFITKGSGSSSWGQYVAADGHARIWFGASAGANSYFNAGNVGIGTDDPGQKLDIRGDNAQIQIFGNSTSDVAGIRISANNNDTNAPLLYLYADGAAGCCDINSRYDYDLKISTNNTEKMRIKNDGNVGIGTNDPDHLLHVNGNARIGKGGGAGVAVSGGDRYLKISAESEDNNAAVYLGCCYDENGAHKTAIIADNVSNWSRSNLHFLFK